MMRQNARKMHHFEAKKSKIFLTASFLDPSPIGRGHPLPKLHPLCSNIVDDKNCYWNDVNTETETELKLFLKKLYRN